jgi:RNA polymerase sigma factor (sigma-70 family)
MPHSEEPSTAPTTNQWFTTTHWSVVLAAGHSSAPGAQEALEQLCRAYWYPLYAYVRRQGHSVEDAQDLTQEFFRRLLEKKSLGAADQERGRFRTFLLTCLQRFLISEWRRDQADKRGGAKLAFWDGAAAEAHYCAEPVTELTPEKIYEKRWAVLLLERVQTRLREETAQAGKAELFDELKSLLWGDKAVGSYAELSEKLGMTEGALRIAAHRLRLRFRELLRAEIAQTVADPAEIDEEMRHLFQVLGF